MRCCDCVFHQSGYLWNRCCLTGDEYYQVFYDEPCDFIDDNYIVISNCPEMGLNKGDKATTDQNYRRV